MNIIETNLQFNSLSKRTSTKRAILHHAEAKTCSPQDIHAWHKERGWAGAGYHFLIRKDGKVYRLRPEWAIGAHAIGNNSDSVGICFEGAFNHEMMGQAQIQAGRDLVAYLKNKYGFEKVQRHKDVGQTDCPGSNFPFAEIVSGKTSGKTEDTSTSSGTILKKGSEGAEVKEWQHTLNVFLCNVKEDGDFGETTETQTIRVQKLIGADPDGVVGNQTREKADIYLSKDNWIQSPDKKWKYRLKNGTCVKSAWKQISGKWYHFDADGWMQTGWLKDKGKWYWLKSSGAMAADELVRTGGKVYYVDKSGKMCYTDKNGALK